MKSSHPRLEYLAATLAYLKLRWKKGLLDPGLIYRNLVFVGSRIMGPHRTGPLSPLIATLAITSRCPCNCYHCSEGYKGSYELPQDAIEQTIDDLVSLGCPIIALTGGEPFSRPSFPELLDRVPNSVATIIYTSGLGLSPELARKLRAKPSLIVCFSLDHTDPAEHDRRRRRDGAHQAIMQGLAMLKGGKAERHVSTLVTRDRLQSGELVTFIGSMKKLGVSCVQVFQPRPTGRLSGDREVLLKPEEEKELFRIAHELGQDPDSPLVVAYPALEHPDVLGCCGGYARVYVDSHGHVCPCDFAPLSFGRITEERFSEIWGRMRGFFVKPGNRCLVRDNPQVFARDREDRNVIFSELADPKSLIAEGPGLYNRFGESFYRAMVPNLLLATSALHRLKGGACDE